ncbi:MAG: dependent ligase [Clostridia bacterium]|nr:dependent ligase [Clostridia bacterium]
MDIFELKNVTPMLISEMQEAFDSPDYYYELKFDGIRCFAYLSDKTVLRNKRNDNILPIYPEVKEIHRQVKDRCLLDGELLVINNGKPDFNEMQRRSLMSDSFKIELSAKNLPVSFVAFDILYLGDKQISDRPLHERKELLNNTVTENKSLAISRFIKEKGISFYNLAKQQELEGIVAKRFDSLYYFSKRTKDWIKIKYLKDDDYVICGYVPKEGNVVSLVLGQYRNNNLLIYKGHVTLGISREATGKVYSCERLSDTPFETKTGYDETTIWIMPKLVCTVKYMTKNESGSMRQPIFKALRNDKEPFECME